MGPISSRTSSFEKCRLKFFSEYALTYLFCVGGPDAVYWLEMGGLMEPGMMVVLLCCLVAVGAGVFVATQGSKEGVEEKESEEKKGGEG